MTSISQIDSNFQERDLDGKSLVFHVATQPPFQVAGLGWFAADRVFCRLPLTSLDTMSEGIRELAWHTSGVSIRFRTNARAVAIDAHLRAAVDMSHMPRTGSSGFDLYTGSGPETCYQGGVRAEAGADRIQSLIIEDLPGDMTDCTVTLPLYNGVRSLSIGLDPAARVEPPSPHRVLNPVAFYGSSITQGGCASRSGNSYPQHIGRWLDADILNFGFSGGAKGELVLAQQLAQLELAAFVYDYDHNAKTLDHLIATHEPFFLELRKRRPNLPVIMVSRPDFDPKPQENRQRRDVIRRTYDHARSNGDINVYFIDGETLFGKSDRDACTVDGCHPNDLGFYRMAKHIYPVVRDVIGDARDLRAIQATRQPD